ncbi:hypothetical protein [Paenalcaligenes faecalis]|uniref:hypothetical protein n=1 Tax=Paenalcaligenes faecalis TaxID=2980099 RepID=UPI0022B942B1|nr:hypothetical protein [Paenalcaligenes faecalis]
MAEIAQLDQSALNEFFTEFDKHYQAKEYADAYPYGIVLFDQGRRDKDFLHHLASVSVFTNKRTPLLKRLRLWAEQDGVDAIAHELIAGLVHHLGNEQENREQALLYAQKNPMHKLEYENVRLHVVVFKTVASGVYNFNALKHSFNIPEGHNNLNGLFAPLINQYSVLVDDVEAAKAAIESLEHVDVIYNAITDPDRCAEALENAVQLCEAFHSIPVVNHPSSILATTRDNNYQRFQTTRHIIYPKNVKLEAVAGNCHALIVEAIKEHDLSFPVIVRLSGYQGGKNMHLITDADSHDFTDFDAVVTQSAKDIYLIEYVNVSFTDKRLPDANLYPKFRAFLAGGKLYPIHLFVAKNDFNVHLANSEDLMSKNKWLFNLEALFCTSPEKVIHKNLWGALEKMLRKTNLDYVGVDFAVANDISGKEGVVVFELNSAMRNWMSSKRAPKHVRVAWEKVTRRMHHVLCDKAKVPAWKFYLPLDSN